jgi:hypothetical protein
LLKYSFLSERWWFMPIIPALGRLRKEDRKFEVSLGYLARPCLKKEYGLLNMENLKMFNKEIS